MAEFSSLTALPEVIEFTPRVFGDDRGFFLEAWSKSSLAEAGLELEFVQENWSRSSEGVLRGLHYQMRHTQGKLVRVTQGEIFDVAVDLRRSSPRFGHWAGAFVSEERKNLLWIPPGFAHGFLSLSPVVDLHYLCTDRYDPSSERTLKWDDPQLGISWPFAGRGEPVLSSKDLDTGCLLADAEVFE